MDVSVLSKHRQRSLRSAVRTSVLGDGLLERTRSTTLALLGLTAAIGLAMVALALNQGWPLIAGAPIPGIGGDHQAVGDAAAVATTGSRSVPSVLLQARRHVGSAGLPGAPTRSGGKGVAVAGAQSPGAAHLVVSNPTPVSPVGQSPPSGTPEPAPVAPPPPPDSTSTPAPATEPAVAPVPVSNNSNSSSSGSGTRATPESPTASQGSVNDEDDEQGHGHRYGRGAGRGHGHSRGNEDQGAGESSESPEPAAAPTGETSPEAEVEADVPDVPESGQSYVPSWGHGGGHSHSHGHGHW